MKEFFRKIASLLMAFLLLASTTSWKVEKHFCMGHLVDISFFTEAGDCGMDMSVFSNDQNEMQEESSCCSDEVEFIDGQGELTTSFDDLHVDQRMFLTVMAMSYVELFLDLKDRPIPHEHYPPPKLVKNIHLLDQVFLI